MQEKAQKILKLTQKETARRDRFVRRFPQSAWMWEATLGMQPMDMAQFIAKEYVSRFGLRQEEAKAIAERFNTNAWWRLVKKLEKDPETFLAPGAEEFRALLIALVNSHLGRNDSYGYRLKPDRPKSKKIAVGKGEVSVAIAGMRALRCRHCWRYVFVDPRKPYRKAPLCPEHRQYRAGTSEYNKRQYRVKAVEQHRLVLHERLVPLFSKEREAESRYTFIRRLATEKGYLLQCLPEYLDSLGVSLASDADLRRAFFMLTDKTLPGYDAHMKDFATDERQMKDILGAVGPFCEKPLPFTFDDILEAEAWLLATKWKRNE